MCVCNGAEESFHKMFREQGENINAVFRKGFYKVPSGTLIDNGILEKCFWQRTVYKAGVGDKF